MDLEFYSLQDEAAYSVGPVFTSMIHARPEVYYCIVLTPVFPLSGELLIPNTDCQSQKQHCLSFWNDDKELCLIRHCFLVFDLTVPVGAAAYIPH